MRKPRRVFSAFAVIVLGGAATPEGVFTAALTTRARAGALASAQAMPAEGMAGPGDEAGVAQAGNRTCVELSSARSTRTGFEPFSAAISTSSSSSRSCRGAIVGLHALAEFCFFRFLPKESKDESSM
eukprot:scaffold3722_cov140-Isochrysis_galbana.AAC.1